MLSVPNTRVTSGPRHQPKWLLGIWPDLAFLRTKLAIKYTRATETKLRNLIKTSVPSYTPELLEVNLEAPNLHMEFLREALTFGETRFFARAMQLGAQHASFPLMYSWDTLSSNLRKYVLYCFLHHSLTRPSLPLLPCPRIRFIDYLEWLPRNGIDAGWNSIRHFAGELCTWSLICGHGGIVDADKVGYDVWQRNFAANVQICTAPRGGDFALRPSMLRGLVEVYTSSEPFDKLMLCLISNMWFSALRPGHFSPSSDSAKHMKHLLEWSFIQPYSDQANGVSRTAHHFMIPSAKSRHNGNRKEWSTATCCICEGIDASADDRRRLRLLCPVCSLERWRLVAPRSRYVSTLPSGKWFYRDAFNKELRRALRLSLNSVMMDSNLVDEIVARLSAKSWRSGASTAVVTAGTAAFIAADFLGHMGTDILQKHYNKAGDEQRLLLAKPLAQGLLR